MPDSLLQLRIIKDRPSNFLVISGDDVLALPTISAGGDGVNSVLGQGVPKPFSKMVKEGLNGNFKEAYALHYQLMPAADLIFAEGNPAGIKAMLAQKEVCSDTVRLPLVAASMSLRANIATYLNDTGL
jgi:4-hydroxy-tetrahydrodipicolinate synthase